MLAGLVAFFSSQPFQIGAVIVLTAIVFFGFIRERIPPDIVALLAMGAVMALQILNVREVFAVFSNPAPITIGAMFVLSAALERTGVIAAGGTLVSRLAKGAPPFVTVLCMMLGVIVLSAFVNNTPVVVILIPVMVHLSHTLGIPPSKLLIPLSFAAILGGTTTLIGTSTNIVVDGVAQEAGLAPFGMFEITAAGAIMALAGALYMALIGPFLLPVRESLSSLLPDASQRRFLAQILIPMGSVLVGKTLAETGFGASKGFSVIDVFRDGVSLRANLKDIILQAGDRVVLRTPVAEMLTLRDEGHIAVGASADRKPAFEPIQTSETVIMEGVIGPQSRLVGRRLAGLGLARLYSVYVLAIHRRGENVTRQMDDVRFEIGDTVLLEGPPRGMRAMFDDGMLNNLTGATDRAFRRDKAVIAIGAILIVVLLAALGIFPIAPLALTMAALVVALGCIDHQEAYRAIRWDVLMLIFGMLVLGQAMEATGAAGLFVVQLSRLTEGLGPLATLAVIYFVAMVLTEMISNTATAILLTPIAIGIAQSLGVDARPFVVAIMFAASASFATPIGYQTNTLVYTAGGYRFSDFLKIGVPLNLVMFAVAIWVIPKFWPLG